MFLTLRKKAIAHVLRLIAFPSVGNLHITSTVVEAKARTKVTGIVESDIVSIGLNADDSFLGVLVNNQQGCFVLVYDVLTLSVDIPGEAFALLTIRIGSSVTQGLAFEWNPATSDMFAASDNGQTLSICKIDTVNPSKYSIVGEKKLNANIYEVSWSPKGKQLVISDALGRIYQMKPDLEDKPPSWTPLNLPLQSSFGVTRKLLVDWNLVLIVTPGTSELLSLSKHTAVWSTTSLVSLPEPTMVNFITGIAVNLSNTEVCTIGDFSTRRLPTVMLLRSDGSLQSFWVAPPSKDYPDCYVSSTSVDVSMIRRGIRLSAAVPCNSNTKVPTSFNTEKTIVTAVGVSTSVKSESSSEPSSTQLSSSVPFGFGGVDSNSIRNRRNSITTKSQLNLGNLGMETIPSTQKPSFYGAYGESKGSVGSVIPSAAQNLASEHAVASKPSIGAGFHITGITHGLSEFAPSREKFLSENVDPNKHAEAGQSTTKSLIEESVKRFLKSWDSYHRNSHSFCINLHKAGNHIDKAVGSLSHVDNVEAIDEIRRMIIELEDEMNDLLYSLKGKKNVINVDAVSRKQCMNAGLIAGYPLNSQRTQYESVVQKYEDFMVKLHKAKKIIMETKKISMRNQPRRLTDFDPKFEGRLHEGLKNLARFSNVVRSRIAELERTASYFTSSTETNSTADSRVSKGPVSHTSTVEIPGPVFIYNSWKPVHPQQSASKMELRTRLLATLKEKKDDKNTIKKVERLRFGCAPSDDTLSSSFINPSSIEATLTQKIIPPIKSKPVITVQNASTQADVPSASPPVVSMPPADVGTTNYEVKDVKPPVEFGSAGFSHFPSVERKQEKPLFSFGSVADETPTKSVLNSECPTKPFCLTPEGPSNSEESLVSQVEKTSDETSITAAPEDKKINVAKPAQESSTGVVTFSFKSKSATESNQSVLSSQSFKFTPKNDTALDTSASVVTSVDADEGMDDDGGAAVPSQKNDSIFGGGFMSGIGSTTNTNAGTNVFGMKTGSLLNNTSSHGGTSSIFSGGMHKAMNTSGAQPSTFASAAQKAVQLDALSQSTTSSSVFGSTPKFGGPPVFGGKPVFGSTAPKPSSAFGGGSGVGGAFSA
ncbi:unnamed protein product [Angiostrongylus costaricensis]|uniref:ANAPC4_WD40 domain-containing protein n=1 Tax=Angiostrongylus costaricensis TaxID=334426 RepID=A0A158PKF6_ANGCS|nr:unnamed protein product [Angiostrongylus costaricensis]